MSNAYNRNQTRGAYGKPKTSLFKRAVPGTKPKASVAPPPAPAPGAFNISDALIDFARPIIDQAGNNHTAIRGAMNVAILIWNALIDGEAALKTAREKLLALPGASAEQIDELLTVMRDRKAEKYPDVKQLVNKYDLRFTKRGARIHLSAINVAPEGIEKTDLAVRLGAIPSAGPRAADVVAADAAAAIAAEAAAAPAPDNTAAAAPAAAAQS